ncbi:hypothetical protein F5Y05DRAFT_416927 [Hypoxylon sp. FL0543]|nr:hypothetical protein F5Y05DRAFT_416927 [Hypoxylon sp. FL0543]
MRPTKEQLEAIIEDDVTNWIHQNLATMPQGYPWDFRDLIRTVSARNHQVLGYSAMVPKPVEAPNMRLFWDGPGLVDDRIYGGPKKYNPMVPKLPDSGAWDYVWYVPEWSHPEFDPEVLRYYLGGAKYIAHLDALSALRPALRPADLVRNPTPWAKRFGIYPDELGGRSRLSPTLSPTRDPFEDFANQINSLSEDEARRAIQLTKEAADKAGVDLPADNPNYIDPMVMEEMLSRHGLMSGAELKENLRKLLGQDDTPNLEALVDALNQRNPQIANAHKTFLTNALRDQDLQRLVFRDLTSDELVADNVFTMSDDVKLTLTGDIHPLFEREHWVHRSWAGSDQWAPRYVYNLRGTREEWDVGTNDAVWQALQPALQLATKVLNGKPAILENLMDLRTRQPVPEELDQRPLGEREAPTLTKIVPLEQIDMTRTYPEIRGLHELGFKWPDRTWQVLNKYLWLEIGSCWISPCPNADGKTEEHEGFTYGVTRADSSGGTERIVISLPAELIWPLMEPAFSQSEKMATSYLLATTLLHEFAHAINYAHQIMTTWPQGALEPPVNADANIITYLNSLAKKLWDYRHCSGEHYWQNDPDTEHGYVFEKQLWGYTPVNILTGSILYYTRQIVTLPMLLEMNEFPQAKDPVKAGYVSTAPVAGGRYPVENYNQPVRIDYMAKFFTQAFWDVTFKTHGFEALKMIPADHRHKVSMVPNFVSDDVLEQVMGRERLEFVQWTGVFLRTNGYAILGDYVKRLLFQSMGGWAFMTRWNHEVENRKDRSFTPLLNSVERLNRMVDEAWKVDEERNADDEEKQEYYENYVNTFRILLSSGQMTTERFLSVNEWKLKLERKWVATFRNGGLLMRAASEVCRYMMDDIAYMERMVFDFFSLHPVARATMYVGPQMPDHGPIGQGYTHMANCRTWLDQLAIWFTQLTENPALAAIRDKWALRAARFRSCRDKYDELLAMLGEKAKYDSNDSSWKKRFTTVPSSFWKNRVDRIQVLAEKEYQRTEPAIRAAVDECVRVINDSTMDDEQVAQFVMPNVAKVTQVVQDYTALGQAIATVAAKNPFQWKRPNRQPPLPPAAVSVTPSRQPKSPKHQSTGGVVFGEPTALLGGRPAIRNPASGSKSGSGAGSSSKAGDDPGTSGVLGPTPGGGIKSTGAGTRNTGKSPIKSPGRTSLNWRGAEKAKTFLEAAAKAGALESLHDIGVPSKTIWSMLGQAPSASSNSAQSAQASTIFKPRQGSAGSLFPNPWADSYTLTKDHEAHTEATAGAKALLQLLHGDKPYSTTGSWRDSSRGDSSDDDEPNKGGDPNSGGDPTSVIDPLDPFANFDWDFTLHPSFEFDPNFGLDPNIPLDPNIVGSYDILGLNAANPPPPPPPPPPQAPIDGNFDFGSPPDMEDMDEIDRVIDEFLAENTNRPDDQGGDNNQDAFIQ